MALSGSFYTNVDAHWRLQIEWSATQNISANTSTITSNFYWIGLDSYSAVYASSSNSGTHTIDGNGTGFSATSGLSAGQKKLLHQKVYTVTHNADGTKTTSISGNYNLAVTLGGTYYGSTTINSGTITLDTIPRKSTLSSSPSWTAPNNLAVTIARASTGFTHTVTVFVMNSSGAWVNIGNRTGIGTSTTFTFSTAENTAIFNALAQAGSRQSLVRVETFNGGSSMGYNDYTGTCSNSAGGIVSFSNFNIGDNVPVTVTRFDSRFTYNIEIDFGSFTKTFTNTGQTPTLTWTSTDKTSMYSQIPNANSGAGTAKCYTYYNGVLVNGALSTNFTAYVTNSNPVFTASQISYADVNSTTKTLTGNNQYIIQNQSSLTAYVNTSATMQNSATFSKYVVTVDGKQGTITTTTGNVNIGTLVDGTNQTLTITAIDSRGNSTAVTMTVNVVPYANPVISASLTRANKFDASTTLKVNGTFSLLNVAGANKNSIQTLVYHYKQHGTSTFGSDQTMTFSTSTNTFTATDVVISLDNTKAWDFEIVVNDKILSFTQPASVGTGIPILFIDSVKNSIGVNKFPSTRDLEVNGGVKAQGFYGNYIDDYILNDHNNGTVTLSALGSQLYLGYKNTTLIRLATDLYDSTGVNKIVSKAGGFYAYAGLDMNNTDIVGANAIYMNDTSTGNEGINFLKTGAPTKSAVGTDYDTFRILDGVANVNSKAIPLAVGGETRIEVVEMSCTGGSATMSGSITFGTAFTSAPTVLFAFSSATVGYVDVMLSPFINGITSTGFSCSFHVYNTTQVFGAGTYKAKFLVFGK